METTWKVLELKRKPDTGLVIEVTWVMNFDLNGEKDRHIGSITLEGDVNDPNYIPYEDLTEEIVLGWVQSDLGSEKVTEIQTSAESRIQSRIDRKNNPEFLTGKPW
jgi:hypothetical protein